MIAVTVVIALSKYQNVTKSVAYALSVGDHQFNISLIINFDDNNLSYIMPKIMINDVYHLL